MSAEVISDLKVSVLQALARYRFLTAAQMLDSGIQATTGHLYATLREMRGKRASPIHHLDFGVRPGIGRLPALYFLTENGAKILREAGQGDAIDAPRNVRLFNNDYFHRVATVDAHIALDKMAKTRGTRVNWCKRYFDRGIDRKRPATSVDVEEGKSIVPDLVASITSEDDRERVFVIEICRKSSTQRVVEQLLAYPPALERQVLNKAFAYEHGIRVSALFDNMRALTLARTRLEREGKLSEALRGYFLFGTVEAFKIDPMGCWLGLDGEPRATIPNRA